MTIRAALRWFRAGGPQRAARASPMLLLGCAARLGACSGEEDRSGPANPDPERGRLLLRQFGCGQCHVIPGVAEAKGRFGPPLEGVAARIYLAGMLPNTAENMASFIREPQGVKPRTAMPDLGVSEAHALDIVAYLQTLKP
jgi:cytochrome c